MLFRSWCARASESGFSPEEKEATFPVEVARRIGIQPDRVLNEMPPVSELAEGLQELIS